VPRGHIEETTHFKNSTRISGGNVERTRKKEHLRMSRTDVTSKGGHIKAAKLTTISENMIMQYHPGAEQSYN